MRWLCLLVAVAGCRTRLLEPPADGATPDLASADLYCANLHHFVEEVPLAQLAAADDEQVNGRAIRVTVGVPLRAGCDLLGQIDVGFVAGQSGAPDGARIVAHRWTSASSDCPPPTAVQRTLVIPNDTAVGASLLDVTDGAAGATLQLHLAPRARSGDCAPLNFGDPCVRDCQCQDVSGARCVEAGGGRAVCEVPCNEAVECALVGLSRCGGGTPASTCSNARACGGDGDCGFGQRCSLGSCRPGQDPSRIDTGCRCDLDCGFGYVCKETVDLAYCQIPCSVDADCPTGTRCSTSLCIRI